MINITYTNLHLVTKDIFKFMNFLSVISAVAKANKIFTIVNLGFDTAMMGVQIAEAVDPDSVCVAWDVRGLASQAATKGIQYDKLLDQIAQISTDLDNISQAILILQTLAVNMSHNWELVPDLEQKLGSALVTLNQQVPTAHKWLGDLEKLNQHPPNDNQLNELRESLKIPDWQIGVAGTLYGISVIGFVGRRVYAQYRANHGPRPRANAFDANDPQWRRKQIAYAVVETGFNLGSFAMNIWQVIQLVNKCEEQANKLRNDISTYDTGTLPLDALIHGCNGDKSKLDSVKKYLKTIDSSQSYDDSDSEKLLNDGLNQALNDYNTDLNTWITELDEAFYQPINASIHAAVQVQIPGISPDLDGKLSSGYSDFQAQKSIANDTNRKSPDRLASCREIVKIFGETVSSTTNQIVYSYQKSLSGVQVESFLMAKAKFIATHQRKLDDFNKDKTGYVSDEGILDDLDATYPDRDVFKKDDPNVISNLANYLDKCIQDLKNNPHS